jgi:protein-tyrosine phosphatase
MEKGMKTFFNFRDLGNLLTEDGRKTPENTFFRSGNWDTASVEETDFLKSLGIKHVFDYRDLSESNGPAKAYSEANVNHNAFPTGVRNQKLLKLQKAGFIKKLRANVSFEDIEETYARLPFDNEGYKAMILAVKNHETPILQHCFAGKDRAGVGTALLLSLLGVKRDIIIEDYMKSTEFEDEFVYYAMKNIPGFIRKIVVKKAKALFTVAPNLINATFKAIEDKYGSMDTYFEMEHGLTKNDIQEIRDFYLVS